MKHTKGPWKKGGLYGRFKTEIQTVGRAIATVWTKQPGEKRGEVIPWPEGEANLNLIKAAPEILEMLWQIEILAEYTPPANPWAVLNMIGKRTRAAIAKAEGEGT